jgi:hypothetical protein
MALFVLHSSAEDLLSSNTLENKIVLVISLSSADI